MVANASGSRPLHPAWHKPTCTILCCAASSRAFSGGSVLCDWVFVDAGNRIRQEVALIQILSTSRGLIT
ncbi:hypothetical protein B296_00018352 [Ensete ventricosum]|uniref:Uncharacterized protein n=1 Tax=Ensete ventricosum TaxID=4639 RepID=A0A426ZVI3_ENSVE|nr:hypothetical protein B296_00018352 [Ensete ventricosum]